MSHPSLPSLAVTGVTGRIGGSVARTLTATGSAVRLLARDIRRAPKLPLATAVEAGYRKDDATRRALTGVHTLFMVSAAETADRVEQHQAFVDAATDAGVRHIVYLSFISPGPDAVFTLGRDHWATEQQILRSGMDHTFLRDNLYAEFVPDLVGDDGFIRGPADEGRVAAVAQTDVVDAAAAVLRQPAAHRDAVYGLTGPDAHTLTEIAALLSDVTGRGTAYQSQTVAEAYRSRQSSGAPPWQLDAWVSTYTAIAAGEFDVVTDHVHRLTGRAPLSLRDALRQRQLRLFGG